MEKPDIYYSSDFSYLWNDLPHEVRAKLMPHMLESQKLHIISCKKKAIDSHKCLIAKYNAHLKNLDDELKRYR